MEKRVEIGKFHRLSGSMIRIPGNTGGPHFSVGHYFSGGDKLFHRIIRPIATGIILLVLISACKLPRLPYLWPAASPTAILSPTPTATVAYEQCGWNWDTQPLPELSEQVQAAMDAAGLTGVTAHAEAYGENCFTAQSSEPLYFVAMETDFRIRVEVDNLDDREKMGNLAETILIVLDGFPTETTPGPKPGYIGIVFIHGEETLNLWFCVTDGESARARGLHGAELLEELLNK